MGAELTLLQYKYQLLTDGAFLQPLVLQEPTARGCLLLTLWLSQICILLALIALSARLTRQWPGFYPLLCSWLLAFVAACWARYQLFLYFGDNFDLAVLANLGGGSIWLALAMVTTELRAQLVPLLLVCGALLFSLAWYWLRRRAKGSRNRAGPCRGGQRGPEPLSPEPRSSCQRSQTGQPGHLQLAGARLWLALALLWGSALTLAQWRLDNAAFQFALERSWSWQLLRLPALYLTDLDFDGYGLFGAQPDPAPFDASRYPGALDIPANQLDEDGLAGDLAPLPVSPADPLLALTGAKPRHLMLVVLESVRADALTAQYNGRPVMPNLQQLAAQGAVHNAAYSHTGFTTSSLKALFNRSLSQQPQPQNLLDLLQHYGYQINTLSAQAERFGDVASAVGLNRPGAYFFDAESAPAGLVEQTANPGSMRLTEQALFAAISARFAKVDWRQPQFFYLNIQAAHYPYSHAQMPAVLNDIRLSRAQMKPQNRALIQASYLNAVANADVLIGQLQQLLARYQVQPLQFFVSDHGESLFEDGFLGHGHQLNDSQTRLLLVASEPLAWPALLGHADLAAVLVPAALQVTPAAPVPNADYPLLTSAPAVLQVIGRISQPQQIALVNAKGRLIYDFRNRQYRTPEGSALQPPAQWQGAANRLMQQWGWLRYQQSQLYQQSLRQPVKTAF